jgi:serine/threonine protein kinase
MKEIGCGSYSTVQSWSHIETNTPVVLKILRNSNDDFIAREKWCLDNLQHPNIIHSAQKVIEKLDLNSGTFKAKDGAVIMIQEHANRGDLFDHVEQSGFLKETEAQKIFVQILKALSYLHNNGIAHMDVKLENVLLHETPSGLQVKLADFGLCKISKHFGDDIENVKDRVGTPAYFCPEMSLTSKSFQGKRADLWAAGVILFTLLVGFPPFEFGNSRCRWYSRICAGKYCTFWQEYDVILRRMGRPIPSLRAKNLINKLLSVEPHLRPSANEALSHHFCVFNATIAATDKLGQACTKHSMARWFSLHRYEKDLEKKQEVEKLRKMKSICKATSAASKARLVSAFGRWENFTRKVRVDHLRLEIFAGSLSEIILKSNFRHALLSWKERHNEIQDLKKYRRKLKEIIYSLCVFCTLLKTVQED